MANDSLARGAKSAQFFTGGGGKVVLKNVSKKPKDVINTALPSFKNKNTKIGFTPFGDYVAIKQQEALDVTEGGIYLSDNSKERPAEGLVVAFGNDVRYDLSIDDVVIFGKYSGVEVSVGGVILLLMQEKHLLGKRV